VVEPSNAWSSLAYLLVGAWLAREARRTGDARAWAVVGAELLIGLGSFAFHATGSFAGELLDQTGMFLLSCLVLAFVAARAYGLSAGRSAALYAGATAASSAALLVVPPAGIPLFAAQLVAGLGWEASEWRRTRHPAYRHLFWGIGIFFVSFGIWLTDIAGVACAPSNHLVTGHAVWHVLNALSIERLYRFYGAIPGVMAGGEAGSAGGVRQG
jgi:hypothetical protein